MQSLEQIRARARTFARAHPKQKDFVEKFLVLLEKIDRGFEGDERERLLAEAVETFERQASIVESTRRTLEALDKLQKQQREMIDALNQLGAFRPRGVTIH